MGILLKLLIGENKKLLDTINLKEKKIQKDEEKRIRAEKKQ